MTELQKALPVKIPLRAHIAMRRIAERRGLTLSMALSTAPGCQSPPFVQARAEMAVELRRMDLSLPRIGLYLGGLHHATVLYLIRKYGPAVEQKRLAAAEIPCPDLSGEWAI